MRAVLIFFFFSVYFWCYAQSSFNLIQDYGYPVNHFRDILVSQDTIYGLGVAFDTTISPRQAVLLVKLDSNAQVLEKKLFHDSLGRSLTITGGLYKDKIQRTSDGGILFFTATPQDRNAILYKLDKNLHVEKIIEFPNEDNLRSNFEYKAVETEDGYLLYGTLQKQDFQKLGFVRLVTKEGEKIWEKRYGFNGIDNSLLDLQILSDSTALLVHNIIPDYDLFNVYWGLRIINLNTGSSLKYIDSSNEEQDQEPIHALALNDGSIILYTNELVGPNTQYYEYHSLFTKFNPNLDIEWKRYWGRSTLTQTGVFMNNSYVDPDGNIVTMGKIHRDTIYSGFPVTYPVGWIFKYNMNGDKYLGAKSNH